MKSSFRGGRAFARTSPESITTTGSMDSGPALQGQHIPEWQSNGYFHSTIRLVSPSNSMLQNVPPW